MSTNINIQALVAIDKLKFVLIGIFIRAKEVNCAFIDWRLVCDGLEAPGSVIE